MGDKVHPSDRLVLHCDMDAFFAAVEVREDPKLRGRPVVIGSDPKGGRGRGIVATCNYEARKYGVHSAQPISQAYRACPHAVFLRGRHKLYGGVSRKIMDIFRLHADVVEQVGIDEAYLDVSSAGTFEAARALAKRLQRDVAEKERLTVSIGLAANKLVAKIASEHKKPNGLTVVIPGRVREFLDPKPVRALRGVGPKTEARLHGMGYYKVEELRRATEGRLELEFGKFGRFLWREARGLDDRPVDPEWEQKSIGRERTFAEDESERKVVFAKLNECVERVHRDMEADNTWCKTMAVKVRFEDFDTHTKQTTLRLATGSRRHLLAGAKTLFEAFKADPRPYRLVGFSVSKLVPPEDLLPFDEL